LVAARKDKARRPGQSRTDPVDTDL